MYIKKSFILCKTYLKSFPMMFNFPQLFVIQIRQTINGRQFNKIQLAVKWGMDRHSRDRPASPLLALTSPFCPFSQSLFVWAARALRVQNFPLFLPSLPNFPNFSISLFPPLFSIPHLPLPLILSAPIKWADCINNNEIIYTTQHISLTSQVYMAEMVKSMGWNPIWRTSLYLY